MANLCKEFHKKFLVQIFEMKIGGIRMSRSEVLQQERERIMKQLSLGRENRAKLLTFLMDIDDEMEELRHSESRKKENHSGVELSA